ncbi:hypothetical protein [Caballeronia sp. BCC1704]|uniref:hypothetical protein n=1 Tax=Caballeronia sp. BCC1704 TaxID=2676300 RepID=UPI00158F22D9|nr:hypothetical protein [Caballeronia sp. BCC1704]
MNEIDLADALRMAIHVLRVVAQTKTMPSGFEMDAGLAQLHADAADVLEASLEDLEDYGAT